MRVMAPIELGDFAEAPLYLEQVATLPGSPAQVWAELAEPARWVGWFPLMREARWTSERAAAVGAVREVRLRLLGHFRERILAWQPGERFAFTMLASTSPLVARMAEDWRLTSTPGRTQLTWTVAGYPTSLGRALMPALRATTRRLFRGASKNLKRILGERRGTLGA